MVHNLLLVMNDPREDPMTSPSATPPAPVQTLPAAVLLERRPATGPWVSHVWEAGAITVGEQFRRRAVTLVRDEPRLATYLVSGLQVALHVDECESYYYNLISERPRAFVVAHATADGEQPQPFRVSMSFDEAHAYLEGDDQVYAVAVPPELYRWTEAFVVEHYAPEQRLKRKRRDWSSDVDETPSA